MKVAYLGNSKSPHNLRWVTYLQKHFDLVVYSFEDERIPGVETVILPRPTGTKLDYYLLRRRVAAVVTEQQPDLIHAHRITSYGYVGGYVARKLARGEGRRVPFLLSVWGEDVFSFPAKSSLHAAFTRRVLGQADQILSTSNVMARETERYIDPPRPIKVTPFGVDTELFRPAAPLEAPDDAGVPRRSSGEPGDRVGAPAASEVVTVGTVKKLRKRYGVDVLIRAFAAVAEALDAGDAAGETNSRALRLVIVGEGPERKSLEALAKELGVADLVEFRGRVPHAQVPEVLREFDIFAALSITDDESFGVAIIEASAVGIPVLATTVGGLPEVVEEGVTGFLVERKDAEAAATRLKELVRNPALRERMGRAGRAFVEERYSWKVTAERMREIYLEVAGDG